MPIKPTALAAQARPHNPFTIIRAEIAGDDTASAGGITVKATAPVIALCRKLVEAGHDPATPLEAYRGATLCLRVRSIGEAAGLRPSSRGVGFERLPAPGVSGGPPIAGKRRGLANTTHRHNASVRGRAHRTTAAAERAPTKRRAS